MLAFTNRITMTKLNKILFFVSLVISTNLYSATEKPKSVFFSKVSERYNYKIKKKQIIHQIFYELAGNKDGGQLEKLIKQNPWALETTSLSMVYQQIAPVDLRVRQYPKYIDRLDHSVTPLQRAIGNFQFHPNIINIKKIETLLNLGANLNVQDQAGNTPVLNILDNTQPLNLYFWNWMPIVFKILLDKNPDLDITNKFGETVKEKINKLPAEYAKILFGLIDEKQVKPEAKKVLVQSLPAVICDLIGDYITTQDMRKLELDDRTKNMLGEYASFYV